MAPTGLDIETSYSLLSNARRRQLLALLGEARVWTVDALAREIAARDDATVDRIELTLVHNHLPRLADYDVIEWDGRSGDVVRSDRYADLEPLLERTADGEAVSAETPSN